MLSPCPKTQKHEESLRDKLGQPFGTAFFRLSRCPKDGEPTTFIVKRR
jgi:hypothetical protein